MARWRVAAAVKSGRVHGVLPPHAGQPGQPLPDRGLPEPRQRDLPPPRLGGFWGQCPTLWTCHWHSVTHFISTLKGWWNYEKAWQNLTSPSFHPFVLPSFDSLWRDFIRHSLGCKNLTRSEKYFLTRKEMSLHRNGGHTSSKRKKTGDLLASVTVWLGDSPFSGSTAGLSFLGTSSAALSISRRPTQTPSRPSSRDYCGKGETLTSCGHTGGGWERRFVFRWGGGSQSLPASWRHFIVSSTPPKTSRRAKQVKPDPKISQNRVGKVKKKSIIVLSLKVRISYKQIKLNFWVLEWRPVINKTRDYVGWNGYLRRITLTSIVSVWVGQEFGLRGKGQCNTWLSHYFPIPSPIQVLSPLHRQAWGSFVTRETIQMCPANDLWLFIRLRSSFGVFSVISRKQQMCCIFLKMCSDFFANVFGFFCKCVPFFANVLWVFASVFWGFRPT